MNKSIDIIRKTRQNVINFVKDLSIEDLNKVPQGFNNNIAWNMGHIIAAQQGVCYRRAGLGLKITDEFFATYKPESKPERFITAREIEEIERLLFSTLDEFEQDLQAEAFGNYTPWVTRYGVNMDSIEDAITFLPFHEGLHMGYIMALKRAIRS